MGTRHLIAVFIDGTHKVAQYGQWDGYPEATGKGILDFLQRSNLETFKERVRKCHFLTTEEMKATYTQLGISGDSEWIGMDEADRHSKKFPELSRDTGDEILDLILESPEGLGLQDSLSFAADSLFCEWAYVVDFDLGSFEAYKGFNQTPLFGNERFNHLAKEGSEYQPVRLQKLWMLNELPTEADFLSTFKSGDEE